MTIPNVVGDAIQLGRSADPSKNFLITVPDVADGTLTIKRGDDTVVATIDAAGKVVAPGNAQTLQNVAGSRSANTLYTNNTGQTIYAMVAMWSSAYATAIVATVTTVGGSAILIYGSVVATAYSSVSFAVPPGATYMCNMTIGTPGAIQNWVELR